MKCIVCHDSLEVNGNIVQGEPDKWRPCPYLDEPWHLKPKDFPPAVRAPLVARQEIAREILGAEIEPAGLFFSGPDVEMARDLRTVPLFAALNKVREEMHKLLDREPGKMYLLGEGYGVKMELSEGRLSFVFREEKTDG